MPSIKDYLSSGDPLASGAGALSDFGGAVSLFGAAAGSLASARGLRTEGGYYTRAANYSLDAATLAAQNVKLTEASTAIQKAAEQRNIYRITGGIRADVAGAGLTQSGSAEDILRASAQQGALQKQLVGVQGQMNVNAQTAQVGTYKSQAEAYQAQSEGAIAAAEGQEASAAASKGGGILKTIGGAVKVVQTVAAIAAMFG